MRSRTWAVRGGVPEGDQYKVGCFFTPDPLQLGASADLLCYCYYLLQNPKKNKKETSLYSP